MQHSMSNELHLERYSRQTVLWKRGEVDQLKLLEGNVAMIGCGALGSCIAELLVRAGVGSIKLIDLGILLTPPISRGKSFSMNKMLS